MRPSQTLRFPALALATLLGGALAAPSDTFAYLRAGWAWVHSGTGPPVRVPGSQGALLLDLSPTSGTLAFTTAPAGARLGTERAPAQRPLLSAPPYTATLPLSQRVPDPALSTVRARWLRWDGDGRSLVAGTDAGTLGWNLARRQSFVPNQSALDQTASLDGEVTAMTGSVQSPDEPGVLLYGPGARPGTEVFTRSQPQPLMKALRAQPLPTIQRFLKDLDPRAQADDASWVVTPPQVTRDGRHIYFASNAGWGVGSGGSTTFALFEVGVNEVSLQALGWLGTLSGSALDLLPSPDGRQLLILLARHISNLHTPTRAYLADLHARTVRELRAVTPPAGHSSVLSGACWLGDSQRLVLSVAQPRPQDLKAGNDFLPLASEYRLLVLRAADGSVVSHVPGATSPTCAVRKP